jgi:hypothetical protein
MGQIAETESLKRFLTKTTNVIMDLILRGGLGGWVLNGDTSETSQLIEEPLTKEQIKEIYFIFPCPVQDCVNKNKFYRWTHNQCGGGRL